MKIQLSQSEALRQISTQARPYPSYLLPKGGSALALFAAGFLGWNDVIHFARAGMQIECVDTDKERLYEMSTIYCPVIFHVADAWEFAERAALEGREWDVVSVDPFFGDAAEKAWETIYLWVTLAKELVTLTVKPDTQLKAPEGWRTSLFPRSGNASWLVMRRA